MVAYFCAILLAKAKLFAQCFFIELQSTYRPCIKKGEIMSKRNLGIALSLPLCLNVALASTEATNAEAQESAVSPLNVAVTFSVLGRGRRQCLGANPHRC